MNQEAKLGVLGGMGRPTRRLPRGGPGILNCLGRMNRPGSKVLAKGQNAWDAAFAAWGPMLQGIEGGCING